MFAAIGFVVLLTFGLILCSAGVFGMWLCSQFGKQEGPPFLYAGVGFIIVVFCLRYSPFSIVWMG